jgi:hypothetical protein
MIIIFLGIVCIHAVKMMRNIPLGGKFKLIILHPLSLPLIRYKIYIIYPLQLFILLLIFLD